MNQSSIQRAAIIMAIYHAAINGNRHLLGLIAKIVSIDVADRGQNAIFKLAQKNEFAAVSLLLSEFNASLEQAVAGFSVGAHRCSIRKLLPLIKKQNRQTKISCYAIMADTIEVTPLLKNASEDDIILAVKGYLLSQDSVIIDRLQSLSTRLIPSSMIRNMRYDIIALVGSTSDNSVLDNDDNNRFEKLSKTFITHIITGFIYRNELSQCEDFIQIFFEDEPDLFARNIQLGLYTEHGFFKEIDQYLAANPDLISQGKDVYLSTIAQDQSLWNLLKPLKTLNVLYTNAKNQFVSLTKGQFNAHRSKDQSSVLETVASISQLFPDIQHGIQLDKEWLEDLSVVKALAIYCALSHRLNTEADYSPLLGLLPYGYQRNVFFIELASMLAHVFNIHHINILQRIAAQYNSNGPQLVIEFAAFEYMKSQPYNKEDINALLTCAPNASSAVTIRKAFASHYLLQLQMPNALAVLNYSGSTEHQEKAVWIGIEYYLATDSMKHIATIIGLLSSTDSQKKMYRQLLALFKPNLADAQTTLRFFWDVDPLFLKPFAEAMTNEAHTLPTEVWNTLQLLPYMLSFSAPLGLTPETAQSMITATHAQWQFFIKTHHHELTEAMSSDLQIILNRVKNSPNERLHSILPSLLSARRWLFSSQTASVHPVAPNTSANTDHRLL